MFCLLICGKLLFRVYGIVVSSLGTVVSSIGNGCAKGLAQLCHHGVIVVTSPWHSCANAVLQLCQLGDRITSHSLQRMHQILVWW